MVSNRTLHRLFIAALCCAVINGFAETCDEMKSNFKLLNKHSANLEAILKKYEQLAQTGDYCAKNIVGRIFYEGVFVKKDRERAKAIFSDLTNSGYPNAAFNLAYAMSEDSTPDYSLIATLLIGIYTKFIADKENSELASKARDFGYQYFSDPANKRGESERLVFERGIAAATADSARIIREQAIAQREREDTVVSLLMLGMAVKSIASLSTRAVNAPVHTIPQIPAFQPTLYQVTPLGGNMLYLLPLR